MMDDVANGFAARVWRIVSLVPISAIPAITRRPRTAQRGAGSFARSSVQSQSLSFTRDQESRPMLESVAHQLRWLPMGWLLRMAAQNASG
jgi:hypothetical protein